MMREAPGGRSSATGRAPTRRRRAVTIAVWVLALDAALVLAFGLLSTDQVFLSGASFQNIASAAAMPVVLAVGFALLLGAGEFDLSLGANLVLSSVVGAKLMTALGGGPWGVATGVAACVAVGSAVGAFNGVVVARARVNSLIATLGTTGVASGLALVVTDAADVPVPPSLQDGFGLATMAGVPLPALVALAVAASAAMAMAYTRMGIRLLAIGSLRSAATRAGVRVDRFVVGLFTTVGALAGLAGFLDLARFATTTVSGHTLDPLAAAAAAVIGGTAISGGRVSILGAVAGALLAVILQTGLVIVGLPAFYQQITIGAILIAAVAGHQWRHPRPETD